MFHAGSKNRLTRHDVGRFAGTTLFDRVGRSLCGAGVLPRKELYEAWEVARRARRRFRGGRVVDLAGGHGLLAHVMLILDDSSPDAVVVDPEPPESSAEVSRVLVAEWPRLLGRVAYVSASLDDATIAGDDVVVSTHACGALTDRVLDAAIAARARVAVLPCCHDADTCDPGGLRGWMDFSLAVDAVRAERLRAAGYAVWTQSIPAEITPKHRLLLGEPSSP
jgi:hypothetical protein